VTQAQRDINRKLRLLRYAYEIGSISKTCQYFGISRQSYYSWKKAFAEKGEEGLVNSKPCPENPKLRTPTEIEEKIPYLRNISFGPASDVLVFGALPRHQNIQLQSLLRTDRARPQPPVPEHQLVTKHYEKQVPGHHIQVDVKFLKLKTSSGKKVRHFQYTAVDDATRILALKIYKRQT
jgi:hypothetical protein